MDNVNVHVLKYEKLRVRYLVAEEASHVDRLGRVILGEGLDLTPVALGTLLGQEALRDKYKA